MKDTIKKVRCTEKGLWENSLTEGEEYEVVSEKTLTYIIIDNFGKENHYFKKRFENVK